MKSPVARVLSLLGAVFLGGVLLIAALSKAADPGLFAEQIAAEGLDFWWPALWVALLALALETALGFALLLGIRRLWILVPTVLLVAFFLFLTGRAYSQELRGEETPAGSCGCFGHLVERTAAEAFWQDLALLVPPLLLAFLGRPREPATHPWGRLLLAVTGTGATLAVAASAYSLPLDDLVTRLRPGVLLSELCVESVCVLDLLPEAEDRTYYLVLLDTADPDVGLAVDALNGYLLRGEGPDLAVLAGATPDELSRFNWQWGPVFQVLDAPSALLRPLYRRLPRSFLAQEGRVVETYNGLPPALLSDQETGG